MPQPLADVARILRTVRYLRPAQIFWRIRYLAERRLGPWRVPPIPSAPVLPDTATRARLAGFVAAWATADPPEARTLAQLRQGQVALLNAAPTPVDEPLPWHDDTRPRLWRYHLHYHDYAFHLARAAAGGHAEAGDEARMHAWLADWADKNPPGTEVAWDAYCIAQRLVYWALADTVFPLSPALWASYARQAEYLLRHLEHDLGANHLLKDACALAVAGAVLDDDQLRDAGMVLLEQEVAEQFLPDGGHYERSPMYHAAALFDLLVVHAVQIEPPVWLNDAAVRATAFLAAVQQPDGEIPLFGDAALGMAPKPSALVPLARKRLHLKAAPAPACHALTESGYFVLGPEFDRNSRLIVRMGPPGPDYQLGHARGDVFSFEWVVGGQRVLVNPGTYEYAPGTWREYQRSVRAHNAVQVGDREPIEAWSSFRTGRRYRVVGRHHGLIDGGWAVAATHDGYAPFCCARRVVWDAEMEVWHICDFVGGPESEPITSYLHWHPDAPGQEGNGPTVVPFGVQTTRTVQGVASPRQGWYSPEFGVVRPSPAMLLRTYCYKDFVRPPWAEPVGPLHVGALFGYSLVPRAGHDDAALYERWHYFATGGDRA